MRIKRLLKASRLVELGACSSQVEKFRELWGDQVYVTVPRMVAVADKFDWNWGARRLLSVPAWAEYKRVHAAAWAEYKRVHAPALAEYERVRAPALAEYERVRAAAWARLYIQEGFSMNNSRGADMLAALKPGAIVTVQRSDGGQSTGRAELRPTGHWYARTGPLFSERITESNIISIRES